MKLITFITLISTLQLSATTYSQNARVSINISNGTLTDLFKEIENQSEYKIFYKVDQINLQTKLNYSAENELVSDVLNDVLANKGATFDLVDKVIVITPASVQEHIVAGVVTDVSGLPLVGVNVVVKGTTRGVVTDIDGKYSVEVPDGNAVLQFSFVGYLSEERSVGAQTTIDITLIEDIKKLEEIVVVGYGTVKKSDVTGALTSVSEKTIRERPVQNAIQAMQGNAAGVDIVSNVRPGEVASINIRGTRSITASNSPLFVVDGIILMGTLNDINPNDIASMEILKDASATAIYGSRGANGVILITTKKGTKGMLSVNYDASVSFDKIHSLTDWASAGEAIDRMRLAEINGGTYRLGASSISYPDPSADITKFGNSDATTISAIRKAYEWNDPGTFNSVKTRPSTPEEIAQGWPSEVPVYNSGNIPTTDWIGLLTRTGITHNHLISLSGGNEKSRLYLSVGYYNNEGTQKNQGFDRYTARINGDITPLKWITVGTSINAAMTKQQFGTINRSGSATGAQDAYGMALSQYIMAQPYDDKGQLIEYPGNNKSLPVWNPLIDLNNTSDERRAVNIQANLYTEITLTKWLKYRMNFGTGFRYQRNGAWQGSQSTLRRTGTPPTAAANYSTGDSLQYMIENLLFLNKTFGKHTFGATLMQSAQSNRTESSNINASKLIYDSPTWYNQSANLNGNPDRYGTSYNLKTLQSFMGRINYSLLGKYLFTATGRFDGASVLATGHKWDFFPSFAVAWKMQEESFLKPFGWLNELKLRAGYGVVGNSAVSPYSTSGPLAQYNYVFGTTAAPGYAPFNMPNPSLTWEKTSEVNLGLDFGFLSNRISGNIELYQSDTRNNILNRSIPATTGYAVIVDNIGKMRNKGIEISLTTVNIQTNKIRWTTNFNWTKNKEEIVELANGKVDMTGNNWYIGQPVQAFKTYEVDGLWQDTPEDQAEIALWKANGYTFAPGQYKPVEQGVPDHRLDNTDKVIRGTVRPKWVAGLTNSVSYMNFELSALVYARVGQSYFSSLQPGGSTGGSFVGYVRHMDADQFWSPDNPGGKWPQPTTASNSNADVNRATYINNGSFVCVRNIALAYNIPQKWLNKYTIKNFQVYGQVLNPFIFGGEVVKAGINPDDANGWTNVNSVGDPTGGTNNNTMMIRSWVLGIRVGF